MSVAMIGGLLILPTMVAFQDGEPPRKEDSSPDKKIEHLLKERVQAAKDELDAGNKQLEEGRGIFDLVLIPSRRQAIAQFDKMETKAQRVKGLQVHFDNMKKKEEIDQMRFDAGRIPINDLLFTRYYRLEAEIWLESAKAGKSVHASSIDEQVVRSQEEATPRGPRDFDTKVQKLLQAQIQATQEEIKARTIQFEAGRGTLDSLLDASRRLMVAEFKIAEKKADQMKALTTHLQRMKKIEEMIQGLFNDIDVSEAKYYRLEAEILYERNRVGTSKKTPNLSGPGSDNPENIKKNQTESQKLQKLLQERIEVGKVEVGGRMKDFEQGSGTLEFLLAASGRLLRAEMEVTGKKTDHLKALQAHFDRMKKAQDIEQKLFDTARITLQDLCQAKYYRFEAEIWLERARTREWKLER
jgi:hypothetical protein